MSVLNIDMYDICDVCALLFQIWVHKRSHAEVQGTVKPRRVHNSDAHSACDC